MWIAAISAAELDMAWPRLSNSTKNSQLQLNSVKGQELSNKTQTGSPKTDIQNLGPLLKVWPRC